MFVFAMVDDIRGTVGSSVGTDVGFGVCAVGSDVGESVTISHDSESLSQ